MVWNQFLIFYSLQSGLTALHIAAFMGHFKIVELLVRYKVNLDTVNVVSALESFCSNVLAGTSAAVLNK